MFRARGFTSRNAWFLDSLADGRAACKAGPWAGFASGQKFHGNFSGGGPGSEVFLICFPSRLHSSLPGSTCLYHSDHERCR